MTLIRSVFIVLMLVGALGVSISMPAYAQGFFDQHPLIGRKAPDVMLKTMQGSSQSLAGLISGKKAVVFFWATWCPHCRTQIRELVAAMPRLKAEGIEAVFIDIGEEAKQVERFRKSMGLDIEVLLDIDTYAAEVYQIIGVPTMFLIGADGVVRDMQNGFPDNVVDILK